MCLSDTENQESYKLFVGNVPFKCNLNEFEEVFRNEKGFVKAELIYRVRSRLTRGFGFVEFDTLENSNDVVAKEFEFENRTLRVTQYATDSKPKEHVQKSEAHKLFVRNLDDTTEDQLRNTFNSYGEVLNVHLLKDRDSGDSRGLAIVEFEDKDAFEKALQDREVNVGNVNTSVYRFRSKFTKPKPQVRRHDGDNKSIYRQGVDSGHAVGYSEGYASGYSKGFDDSTNGLPKDSKKNYLKSSYLQNVVNIDA